ncbi:MAG: PBP1A family penicillin-binding protein [Spirochaetaceae bacterium]|nr:PBP1A family penicillin-binding protein [Spirochaetaceae bacterium]
MEKIRKRTYVLFFLAIPFALIFGAALGALVAQTINTMNTENFTEFNPSLPTKLLDINGELITEFSADEKREMIDIIDIPQHVIDALITREDKIFFEHRGFSLRSIMRAVIGKITGKTLGGGSTLTQQIAGTLYCDRTDISYSRKLKELWWAIQMERRFSKNEILELYLNKVYLGGGTYGINAASKYYFGHDASKLTPAESAILVIQLSNPAYYNPFDYPNRAQERQRDVLNQMVESGYLTAEAADESFEDFWTNFDYIRTNASAYSLREDAAPWFSEYVLRELNTMLYGTMNVYTDGFTVNTTLNLRHQEAAQQIMTKYINYANETYQTNYEKKRQSAINIYIPMTELISLVFNIPEIKTSEQRRETEAKVEYKTKINPILDVMALMNGLETLKMGITNKASAAQNETTSKDTIEGTMISLENSTGYINALVGGSVYDKGSNEFIRATQATLQPGSSFKPLYYSAAIDSRKFTAATQIYDMPIMFYTEDGSEYYIENFKGTWEGSVQLWYALATSMNVPSMKVLNGVGFDAAIKRAQALLGIPDSELEERKLIPVYPIGLGVCTVQPIQMARAFAIFANQGKEVTPMAIRTVENRKGTVVINPEREIREAQQKKGDAIQVITPQTAFIMTSLLQNTVTVGTLAKGSGYFYNTYKFRYKNSNGDYFNLPAGGKTGTTQNWADAWTVGFTPYYTSAFWFGFDQKGKTLGLEMTGSTLAGHAWGDFMHVANDGLPYKSFFKPQTGIVEAQVCSVSGLLPTEACGSHLRTFYFLEGTEPTTLCELHIHMAEAKEMSVSRLKDERLQAGNKGYNNVSSPYLNVDLSFLDSYKNVKDLSSLGLYTQDSFDTSLSSEKSNYYADPSLVPDIENERELKYNYLLD